jgi:hypothetical protein
MEIIAHEDHLPSIEEAHAFQFTRMEESEDYPLIGEQEEKLSGIEEFTNCIKLCVPGLVSKIVLKKLPIDQQYTLRLLNAEWGWLQSVYDDQYGYQVFDFTIGRSPNMETLSVLSHDSGEPSVDNQNQYINLSRFDHVHILGAIPSGKYTIYVYGAFYDGFVGRRKIKVYAGSQYDIDISNCLGLCQMLGFEITTDKEGKVRVYLDGYHCFSGRTDNCAIKLRTKTPLGVQLCGGKVIPPRFYLRDIPHHILRETIDMNCFMSIIVETSGCKVVEVRYTTVKFNWRGDAWG